MRNCLLVEARATLFVYPDIGIYVNRQRFGLLYCLAPFCFLNVLGDQETVRKAPDASYEWAVTADLVGTQGLKRLCENSISKLSPAGTAELSPGR